MNQPELERTVIAIIINAELNNSCNQLFHEAREKGVREEFFNDHLCASIWNSMEEIDKDRSTIDEVSLMTRLREKNVNVQDYFLITECRRSELHYKQSLDELVETYRRRRLLRLSREMEEALSDGQTSEEVLSLNELRTNNIMELAKSERRIDDILSDTISDLFNPVDSSAFIRTGIDGIDKVLYRGGYGPSQLCVVAARPGGYKTAYSLNYAKNACIAGKPTLMFNLEMGDTQLMKRMLSIQSAMPMRHFVGGCASKNQAQHLKAARDAIAKWPLFIKDNVYNLAQILATARGMHRKHQLGTIIVDYCQLIKPMTRGLIREQQIAEISRELKLLAKDLNIPVVLLAQLNRESEKDNRKPVMSDLRESGALEADADSIIMPWRTNREKEEDADYVRWALVKQREGVSDASGAFAVNKECGILSDYHGTLMEK